VDSKQYQGSSSHSAGTVQQNNTARVEPASDKPWGRAAASERRRQQPNSLRVTPPPAPYRLRSPAQRSVPAHFRYIQTANFETYGRITMDSRKKCSGRTVVQKKRRHERNRGPWTCGLCEHDPFCSIAGFRNHTTIEHKQNCSWTGNVTAPENDDHLVVLTSSVRNSQSHKSAKRRREKEPSPSTPSKSQQSSSSDMTSRAVRCYRIRLSSLPVPDSRISVSLTCGTAAIQIPNNVTQSSQIPAEDAVPIARVGGHSIECQTPIIESLFLPEGLILELLLDMQTQA